MYSGGLRGRLVSQDLAWGGGQQGEDSALVAVPALGDSSGAPGPLDWAGVLAGSTPRAVHEL